MAIFFALPFSSLSEGQELYRHKPNFSHLSISATVLSKHVMTFFKSAAPNKGRNQNTKRIKSAAALNRINTISNTSKSSLTRSWKAAWIVSKKTLHLTWLSVCSVSGRASYESFCIPMPDEPRQADRFLGPQISLTSAAGKTTHLHP